MSRDGHSMRGKLCVHFVEPQDESEAERVAYRLGHIAEGVIGAAKRDELMGAERAIATKVCARMPSDLPPLRSIEVSNVHADVQFAESGVRSNHDLDDEDDSVRSSESAPASPHPEDTIDTRQSERTVDSGRHQRPGDGRRAERVDSRRDDSWRPEQTQERRRDPSLDAWQLEQPFEELSGVFPHDAPLPTLPPVPESSTHLRNGSSASTRGASDPHTGATAADDLRPTVPPAPAGCASAIAPLVRTAADQMLDAVVHATAMAAEHGAKASPRWAPAVLLLRSRNASPPPEREDAAVGSLRVEVRALTAYLLFDQLLHAGLSQGAAVEMVGLLAAEAFPGGVNPTLGLGKYLHPVEPTMELEITRHLGDAFGEDLEPISHVIGQLVEAQLEDLRGVVGFIKGLSPA